jgi:hypothetical protein
LFNENDDSRCKDVDLPYSSLYKIVAFPESSPTWHLCEISDPIVKSHKL